MNEIPEKPKSYWKAILGYSLVAVALGIFFWGNHVIQTYKERSMASREWPTVAGRIIASQAMEYEFEDSDGNITYHYKATITYEYVVNGARYTSDQIGWQDDGYRDSMLEAQMLANSYALGKAVVVHYDPEKPEFGLLNTTLPTRSNDAGIGYLIGSGAILAIAAALIFSYTGLIFRIPRFVLIIGSFVTFIGGGVLWTLIGDYFTVLIGFGFAFFAAGLIARIRR